MSAVTTMECHHNHCAHNHCAKPVCKDGCASPTSKTKTWQDTAMRVLEVVCFLGIAAYASYLSLNSLNYFLPFVGAGFLIGFVMQYKKLQKDQSAFQEKECGGNCDQSTMSRLTRLSLPEPLGLLGAVAMTADHMTHHKRVSIPIVGLFSGAFFGALAANAVHYVVNYKKAAQPQSTNSPESAPLTRVVVSN